MSFSQDVRGELSRLPLEDPCCNRAELAALTQWRSSLMLSFGGPSLQYEFNENAALRRAFRLVKSRFDFAPAMSVAQQRRLDLPSSFRMTADGPQSRLLLTDCGLMTETEEGLRFHRKIKGELLRRACCRRAYVRGALLAAGSVTAPEKGTRLEFTAPNRETAEQLIHVLQRSGIPALLTTRKEQPVVYIKDGDAVSDTLGLAGASGALLKTENARMLRQLRNDTNRAYNCDLANTDRLLKSANEQIRAIETIYLLKGYDYLKPDLALAAEVRVNNPEASLNELAAMTQGQLTKSALYKRLKKLEEIAQTLEGGLPHDEEDSDRED